MLNFLQKNGVSAVDINSAFLKAKQTTNPETLFFRNDTHWTPYGALIAAQAVADYIKDFPEIKNSEVTEYNYIKSEKENNGDLVKFLWSDVQKQIPPENYVDYQYEVSKSEVGLLDDSAPTIALVGTSYSNNNTRFLGGLQYVLKREVIDFSVAGGMVEKPLPEYLKSDTYRLQKPKLIIWEIPEGTMWSLLPNDWYKNQILDNLIPK